MSPQKKKKTRKAVPKKAKAAEHLNPMRTGMPALDSIVDVKEFRKGKKVYRLIRTNEVDEYEQSPATKRKRKRSQ